MGRVARYVKLTAKPGAERSLAELMLESAELLEQVPGCELYLINRTKQDPAVVWVTEIWRSQEELNGSLQLETVTAHLRRCCLYSMGRRRSLSSNRSAGSPA
jgi:quinol monooxygenase YgiN